MQENEFEKRVQEMMEELKMPPSDAVWGKVEQQIPQQKRRRRWMIFVFLLTGLMVSGYFVYNNYNNRAEEKENIVRKDMDDKTKDSLNNNKKNEKPITSVIEQKNSKTEKIDKKQNAITVNKDAANKFSDLKDEQKINKPVDENVSPTAMKNDKKETEKNGTANDESVQQNILNGTSHINTKASDAASEKHQDSFNKPILKDSTQAVTANSNKKQTKNNTNKKWQIGVTAFYGRSDVFENLWGIKLNSAPAAYYNANPGTVSGFTRNPNNYSKDIKAKGAFSLGIAIQKNLSSKSGLTIALQYSKFQTQIETGGIENSAATFRYNNLNAAPATDLNNYYKPGAGYPHKNSYNFIQLPVIYEHSITKNKFLNWNAGASISRLISSNVLVYDSYNQAYYNNKDLFRKTNITLLAGINIQFKLGATSVHLGPQFQYGLTNLFKHNDYGSQHLFSWGLQTNIFLKK